MFEIPTLLSKELGNSTEIYIDFFVYTLQDKRVEISFFLPALLTVFLYTYSAPATVPKSN